MPERDRLGKCLLGRVVDPDEHDVVGQGARLQLAQRAHLQVEDEALRVGERRFVRAWQERGGDDDRGDHQEEEHPLQSR